MTAPLSGQFEEEQRKLATGQYGGRTAIIAPRGKYTVAGVGDPRYGYTGAGIMWNEMPAVIGGLPSGEPISTTTGVPVGTPAEESMEKVGGGVNGTQADELPTGNSVGGTAAY
jgi:hypothetical protein